MIDTLRLNGYGSHYRFKADISSYIVIKSDDEEERILQTQIDTGTKKYYAAYSAGSDKMTVEFNVHKLLFEHNIYNYETNAHSLDILVNHFARYFFGNTDVFVSRCDIGGVYTAMDGLAAHQILESFRAVRPPHARTNKYKNQNFASSVFYPMSGGSVKIYNKGAEMEKHDKIEDSGFPFKLKETLRFEKSYRARMMKPFMPVVPFLGVHVADFSTRYLLEDFFKYFESWERISKPYAVEGNGMFALLNVINKAGLSSQVESEKLCSQSTWWRYRKAVEQMASRRDDNALDIIRFDDNLPQNLRNVYQTALTFGVSSLFA